MRAPVLAGALLASVWRRRRRCIAVTDWDAFADGHRARRPPPVAGAGHGHDVRGDARCAELRSSRKLRVVHRGAARAKPGASPDAAVGEAAYRALKGSCTGGARRRPSTRSITAWSPHAARLPEHGMRRWCRRPARLPPMPSWHCAAAKGSRFRRTCRTRCRRGPAFIR